MQTPRFQALPCALCSTVLALACTQSSSNAAPDYPVIGGWEEPGASREMMLPSSIESWAEVIAVGEVHEPVEKDGRRLLKVKRS